MWSRTWIYSLTSVALVVLVAPGSGCRCERRGPGAVKPRAESAPAASVVEEDAAPAPLAVPTLTPRHAHTWGGAGDDAVRAVLADGQHAIIAGTFEGALTLGGHTLTSAGEADVFVARVAPASGEVQWAQRVGGPGDDAVAGLARLGEDRLAVAGSFEETLELGGTSHTSAGKKDLFVAELSAVNGAVSWSRSFGGEGVDVAADVDAGGGALVIAGYFMKTLRVGAETLSAQSADVLLLSLDAEGGAPRWARGFGGPSSDKAAAVALAPDGDVLVTGAFRRSASFGGDPLACAGSRDGFLARYDAEGAHRWSLRFGGEGVDGGNALAVGEGGEVALAGTFQGRLELGGEVLESGDQRNPLIAYFDAKGTPLWAHGHRSDLPAEATALTLTEGALWVAGVFQGEIDLGGGLMRSEGVSRDLFIVRESLEHGAHEASLWLGGEGRDEVAGVAALPGQLLLVGDFEQNTDYAGHHFESAGGSDAWMTTIAR